MSWITGFAVYFIIWWVTLFSVLSFGLRTQEEEGEVVVGTEPSAPARPRLLRLFLVNSTVAGIIFALWYVVTYVYGYGVDDLSKTLYRFLGAPD